MKTELKSNRNGTIKEGAYMVTGGGASLEVKHIYEQAVHYHKHKQVGGVNLDGLYHLKLPLNLAIIGTFIYHMFALILTAFGAL